MKLRVDVWGKTVEVDVYQKSKSVWVASGEYMGQYFQTTDRSATTAAKRWAEGARSRGA